MIFSLWLIWVIVGIIFFIIELFTPILFFLNFGLAALIVAGIDYFVEIDLVYQILIWAVCSGLLLLLVRPLLLKNKKDTDEDSGINAKYIGKEAKTIMPTGKEDGRVTIYGEDWFARSIDGNEIEKDVVVKIIKCENSILYVEKI